MAKTKIYNNFIYDGTEAEVIIGMETTEVTMIKRNIYKSVTTNDLNDNVEVRYYKKTKEFKSPSFKTIEEAINYELD